MATESVRPTTERSHIFTKMTIHALLHNAGGEVILPRDIWEDLHPDQQIHMETLPNLDVRLWLSHGVGRY